MSAPSTEADEGEGKNSWLTLFETPFVRHGGVAQHCGATQYDATGVPLDRHPLASKYIPLLSSLTIKDKLQVLTNMLLCDKNEEKDARPPEAEAVHVGRHGRQRTPTKDGKFSSA